MEKLAELKEKLKELSPEELEELKTFLTEQEKTEENAETEETEEAKQTEEPTAEEKTTEESSETDGSPAMGTVPVKEGEEVTEVPDEVKDETKPEETSEEELESSNELQQEPSLPSEDSDIPAMQKITPTGDNDAVDKGLTSETGENIPVDYEQIIEGQNAKIAALEAELASYKAKVDGAFGYSAKTTMPAKVNRLYDECEDVHIHK